MAYPNSYFPVGYQPYQPQPQMQMQQPQQLGLIRIPNEESARAFPLAPNTSGTFIDENAPYIYTKTMGASQFEHPKFEKYRLVKEDAEVVNVPKEISSQQETEYVSVADFEKMQAEVKSIKNTIKNLQKELTQKGS